MELVRFYIVYSYQAHIIKMQPYHLSVVAFFSNEIPNLTSQ